MRMRGKLRVRDGGASRPPGVDNCPKTVDNPALVCITFALATSRALPRSRQRQRRAGVMQRQRQAAEGRRNVGTLMRLIVLLAAEQQHEQSTVAAEEWEREERRRDATESDAATFAWWARQREAPTQ